MNIILYEVIFDTTTRGFHYYQEYKELVVFIIAELVLIVVV